MNDDLLLLLFPLGFEMLEGCAFKQYKSYGLFIKIENEKIYFIFNRKYILEVEWNLFLEHPIEAILKAPVFLIFVKEDWQIFKEFFFEGHFDEIHERFRECQLFLEKNNLNL